MAAKKPAKKKVMSRTSVKDVKPTKKADSKVKGGVRKAGEKPIEY